MKRKSIMRIFQAMLPVFFFCTGACSQVLPPLAANKYRAGYNQKKNAVIIYDFNAKSLAPPDTIYQLETKGGNLRYKTVQKLWYGKRVNMKVRLNPYLYDVSICSRQVNDEGMIDSTAARLFTTGLITLSENKKALDSAQANAIPRQEETAVPKTGPEVIDTLIKAIDANLFQTTSINTQLTTYNDAKSIAEALDSNQINIRSFNLREQEAILNLEKEFALLKREYVLFKKYLVKEDSFYSKLNKFYETSRNLQSYYDLCENSVLLCLKDKLSADEIIKTVDTYLKAEQQKGVDTFINTLPANLFYYKNEMDAAYRQLQAAFTNLKRAVFKSKYFENIAVSPDSVIKASADTLYNRFSLLQPDVFIKSFFLMIKNFQNPESFVHSDFTKLIIKDSLIYTIEVKPSERFRSLISKYGIKLYSEGKSDYRVPVKGNFKVNFSIGAAFMFNAIRPRDYHFSTPLENLPDDSSLVTINEKRNGNSFIPAIAAYTHGYIKLGGWFTPAVTIGLSTNPVDFTDASYFAGLSLICGQQSRLIFTIGKAGSSVDVLKSRYDLNRSYIKKDLLNIQEKDLTRKAFKSGWFWGVSYNISSNR